MARKNFKDIDIYAGIQQKNGQQWQQENGISANWRTPLPVFLLIFVVRTL